jgi:hypothetical protein
VSFCYGLAIDFECEVSVCNFILILKFQNVTKTTQRLKRKNATPVNVSRQAQVAAHLPTCPPADIK